LANAPWKANAQKGETAWANAGKNPGLLVWRIEKFKVVPIPRESYGAFFSGDSYIVLHTVKRGNSFKHDIHFWLGANTTQDESGTAAYKTVELDNHLGGGPVQHREVEGHESDMFLSYFQGGLRVMEGGVESGFNAVKPEVYRPRLLHLKGRKFVRVREVPLTSASLNSGDVFILDAGLKIYQFNGAQSAPRERNEAAKLSRAIDDERAGKPVVIVIEENDTDSDANEFWSFFGGRVPIATAAQGGSDEDADRETLSTKKLIRLSDAGGVLQFSEVASGRLLRSQLDSNDVFFLDSGDQVFVWIGKGASNDEKQYGIWFAQQYIQSYGRPAWLPITRIFEGGENEMFNAAFSG